MHNSSRRRLQVLELSLESYKTSAATLPRSVRPLEDPDNMGRLNDYCSTRTSGLQTPTKRVHMQHSEVVPSFPPIPQKRFTHKSIGALIPSPLHIHNDADIINSPVTPPRSKTMTQLHDLNNRTAEAPPFTPPRNIIPSTPPTSAQRLSVSYSASSYLWLKQRSSGRYNRILADFRNML